LTFITLKTSKFQSNVDLKLQTVILLHIRKVVEFCALCHDVVDGGFAWCFARKRLIDVLNVIFTFSRRNKGRWHIFLLMFLPVYSSEKLVIFNFLDASRSRSQALIRLNPMNGNINLLLFRATIKLLTLLLVKTWASSESTHL
jgi:hypothetical protein